MAGLMKKTRGWKLPLFALIAFSFALSYVLTRPQAVAKAPVVAPSASPYASAVGGIGVVEPKSETISIGVDIPGVVRTIHVKVGDKVKKGQPLFTLDTREVDAQIASLEASIASAKVQAQDAAAQYGIVASMKDRRAVAKDDVNRRLYAKQLAAAKVREAEAQLQQAKTTKARSTINAPITGQVLEVNVRPGEFASAGVLPSPLMRMGDTSQLYVRVEIDEENAAGIDPNATATGFRRGDTTNGIGLSFVRFEPFVKAKQNLAVAGQRVDTRVLQILYSIDDPKQNPTFVGQQMDVFIERPQPAAE